MISIIKLLFPLFSGLLAGIFKRNMEAKNQMLLSAIEGSKMTEKSRRRAASVKDENAAWVRRFLAILFSVSLIGVIAALILIPIFKPDLVINVPHDVYKHSLWSFLHLVKPTVIQDYVQLKGITLVPTLLEPIVVTINAIVGFYFGSRK